MTEKRLLICSCFNQDKKAKEAFSVLFPKEELPEIIRGKDRIYKFAKERNNKHIEAISKLAGKFADFVELEGEKIVKEYDLIHGKRLA